MRERIVVFDANGADEAFDETPETGEEFELNEETYLITGVNIINQRKIEISVSPKKSVQRFESVRDPSQNWNKLPDRFLEESNESENRESLYLG